MLHTPVNLETYETDGKNYDFRNHVSIIGLDELARRIVLYFIIKAVGMTLRLHTFLKCVGTDHCATYFSDSVYLIWIEFFVRYGFAFIMYACSATSLTVMTGFSILSFVSTTLRYFRVLYCFSFHSSPSALRFV